MAAEAAAVVARGRFGAPTTQTPHRLHALCRPGPRDRRCRCRRASWAQADVADDPRAPTTPSTPAFYDRPVPGSDVEIMSFAVTVATPPEDGPEAPVAPVQTRPNAAPVRNQPVRDTATGEVRRLGGL